jgi:hypothetical protein
MLGGFLVDIRFPLQAEASNVPPAPSGQRLTLWTYPSTLSPTISSAASARVLKGALGSFATFLLASLKAVEVAPFTDSEMQLAECLLEVSAKIFDHQVKRVSK